MKLNTVHVCMMIWRWHGYTLMDAVILLYKQHAKASNALQHQKLATEQVSNNEDSSSSCDHFAVSIFECKPTS